MKKTVLALLLAGLCFGGTTVQAEGWGYVPVEEVQQAAEQGDVSAQRYLGVYYLYGGDGSDDGDDPTMGCHRAMPWFRKAAEQGDAEAQFLLAERCLLYTGIIQNDREAIVWLRKAVEQGYKNAQNSLAQVYQRGAIGVTQDHHKAVELFRKAAVQGLILAQFNLGKAYENGLGITQNFKMAYVWFSVCAANGDLFGDLAAQHRDATAKILSPAKLAEAQTLAGEYLEKYPSGLKY